MMRPGTVRRVRRPSQPYPVHAHVTVMRNAIVQTVTHYGVTYELAASAVVAAVSAAMRGRYKVRLPFGRVCHAATYGFVFKASGDRGTTVTERVFQPLREHDDEAIRQHKEDMARYEVQHDAWATVQDGLRRKLAVAVRKGLSTEDVEREHAAHALRKPVKPRSRRMAHTDLSKRALYEALEGRSRCLFLVTDEGGIVLNGGLIGENGVLNTAWDGGTLRLDRAHGTSLVADDPHVTVLIMAQPEVVDVYLEQHGETARGSGMLARFLITDPPSLKGHRFLGDNAAPDWACMDAFHDRLRELLQEALDDDLDGTRAETILEFDDDAAERWRFYYNVTEQDQQRGRWLADIGDFASKLMENVARLSVTLHVAARQEGRITLDTLERAYAIGFFHLTEAKRIFAEEPAQTELEADREKLERYLHVKVMSGWQCLTRRYVHRNGPVRDRLRYGAALNQLIATGKVWIGIGLNKTQFVNMNLPYFHGLPPD